MTARRRRRRGAAMLGLALACGGLAASEVQDRVGAVERQVGEPVPVVVAARDLEPGTELGRADLRVATVPARFAPPDSPTAVAQAVGLTTSGPVAAGSPIVAGLFAGGATAGGDPRGLQPGERAVEVAVTAAADFVEAAAPGARVDLLVSTEPGDGPARTFLALEDVELLAVRPHASAADGFGADADAGLATPTTLATLRVTLRQAVYLTAAQSFSREVRLLPRPSGDRRRIGRASVLADQL